MSEWDFAPEELFTEPVRNIALDYISKIYMKGYRDALNEMQVEMENDEQGGC